MPQYPPGPFSVQIPYIVQGISHNFEFNCDVLGNPAIAADPQFIDLRTRDGQGASLQYCVNTLWASLRMALHLSTIASTYTLWRRNQNNSERAFVSGGTLTPVNGGEGGTIQLAHQNTLIWRSAGGSFLRIVILEGVFGGNESVPYPTAAATGTPFDDINTFLLSGENWVMARDRSFPVVPLSLSNGQNEKVWRRRFRS